MKRGQFLMRNSKGLSDVLATLMIILLVLVAVGIIWVVVRNVVQQGSEQVDIGAKCLAVDIRAVGVVPVTGEAGNYSVTLKRVSGGDPIGGIKISLFNATTSSDILEFGLALGPIQEKTRKIVTNISGNPALLNANRLDYTPYFFDASGNDRLCSQTSTFNF